MRAGKEPTKDQIELSEVMYALSDPVRLEIVAFLAQRGEQPCSTCCVDMPKSSLSHHYKVLRETGVISTRIEGTRHFNSLRADDLNTRFPGLLSSIVGAICNRL
ncbi:ArsR/SmtB family transcription factor [Paludibaculum fermentans]|uniref:ArsR/SmtB family transcription factor n=1 Tax=Paludibaculum fermentans TaxID=1473598 RepID=UPI003EBDBDD1